ncbi:MAG: hypothetical protein WCC57_14255 [Paracoccaceae bacterium]
MNRREQLGRLGKITDLLLELRLADLETAARARQESLDHLSDLKVPQTSDLPLIAAAQANLLYQRWAEARRADINLTLARQTATWIEAQTSARFAFGQAEALRGLQKKNGYRR